MMSQRFVVLTLAALAVAACDRDPVGTADVLAPTAASAAQTSVPGVVEVVGEAGPGSQYALLKPANWNGELVVYAHGYVQPFFPVTLISPSEVNVFPPVRDYLLMNGFAVAYASWSETGYAVKDGAQRTHQLNGLFDEAFGEPSRTYLVGLSLGGLVVDMLSEKFPAQYDGTLSLCGVMGGGLFNAEYIAHTRVLFDYFFPGALPGSLYEMPENYYVTPNSEAMNRILGAIAANPAAAVQLASMDQVQLKFRDFTELATGLVHALGYQVNGANALSAQLNGHSFFDNTNVRYSAPAELGVDTAALNAGVTRIAGDPSAVNYMENWWQPTGAIGKPFITVHTTRDPLVPFRGQAMFAEAVSEAGASDLLLQRTVDTFGHCNFQPADILGGFHSLVGWVRTGVKPAA